MPPPPPDCRTRFTALALWACFVIWLFVDTTTTPPPLKVTSDEWKNSYLTNPNHTRTRILYLFNLTNPEEYLVNHTKPIFKEVGPMVFRVEQKMVKNCAEDGTMYDRTREFLQVDGPSYLDLNVTNANILLLTALWLEKTAENPLHRRILNFLIGDKEPIFTSQKILDLLKHSHQDRNFDVFSTNRSLPRGNVAPNTRRIQDKAFYDQNGVLKTLELHENVTVTLPQGLIGERVEFSPDTGRFYKLKLKTSSGTEDIYEGCDECTEKCAENGPCIELPITVSQPHFFGRKKLPEIDGMIPNSLEHSSTIIIDRVSKAITASNLSYQINIKLDSIPWSDNPLLTSLPPVEIPILWYKDTFLIDRAMQEDVENFLHARRVTLAMNWALGVLGALVLIVTGFLVYSCRHRFTREDRTALIDAEVN